MKNLFSIFIFVLLFAACKNETKQGIVQGPLTGLKEFDEFYLRFHRDTAYQAAHITFPLEGLPPHADSSAFDGGDFRWNRSDWEFHQLFNDPAFERRFNIFGDFMIEENVLHKAGQLGMIRRFSKMNDEWYLIYYVALNKVRTEKHLKIE